MTKNILNIRFFLTKVKSGQKPNKSLEVCVDSLESVINAYEGGADRVELCSSLNEGGLTPSYGLFKSVRKYLDERDPERKFKVHSMIRCRPGDFNYSDLELETMFEDLKKLIELGSDGVVFGALTVDGLVDESVLNEFMKLIPHGVKTTFHRAFDVCSNHKNCFIQIENFGFDKLLTSGLKSNAFDGREIIKELVSMSKTLQVIAGAGINSKNLELILKETCVKEFHASCRTLRDSKMIFRNTQVPMGSPAYDEFSISVAQKEKVNELKEIFKKFY
ncbi:unnamed protein product [Brachionus calyciflorus]|uniref:Copper homeostasis protein cutC homolog n=1 Tax=Brachionus calyciflorus TaxID=104777 RepID=A0A814AQX7_9BILA|nr:unnamed protein product [Brachionus calyciflorus]